MEDWEEFQNRGQLQQPSQLWICELAHCRAGARKYILKYQTWSISGRQSTVW
jgi:hypothetical protein